MATVSEILRGAAIKFKVLAGNIGLGREVRRVVDLRPRSEASVSFDRGDLVVYDAAHQSSGDNHSPPDRAFSALLNQGLAGVLTTVPPESGIIGVAGDTGTPLVSVSVSVPAQQLVTALERALNQVESKLALHTAELQREFSDLARSGGTRAMLLTRLVETTGKTCLVQDSGTVGVQLLQPAVKGLGTNVVKRSLSMSNQAVRHWIEGTADASVSTILYLELPREQLVRLTAPVWIGGRAQAAISLLAPPADLTTRDRVAAVAAARAIASVRVREDEPASQFHLKRGRYAALVLRAPGISLEKLAAAWFRIDPPRGTLVVGQEDIRVLLPYDTADRWHRHIREWHTRLSQDVGTVSMGHALHKNSELNDPRGAVVQAAEAAILGDHLFGAGHVTSYADAQLAKFLLRRHDAYELSALHERAVGKLVAEDQSRDGELVATLEVYLDTFVTLRAAERLGVHRNTVLYRLKQIEAIASVDLDDGATRLFLQLGLLAGRLTRLARNCSVPQLTYEPDRIMVPL